ncbi:hypothetical protein B0H14DRAFT_3577622 [Mycena olivaceomarginata]|nr:hypothetical protein B0H14DRAFT_3577622 [Mycena olivaceomarginata]
MDILSKVKEWKTHRKSQKHTTQTANDPADDTNSEKSKSKTVTIIDSLTLALELAQQVADVAEAAPFVGPAAKLLSNLLGSYKEMKSANDKRDVLATHIADLAGDMSATVLHMKAINYSDLLGATEFVDEYDEKGKLVRWAARNQLGDEMDNLNQELNAFGDRFRTHRLVDLTINQSVNTATMIRILDNMTQIHDAIAEQNLEAMKQKLENWLLNPPDMKQKHSDSEKLRTKGTGLWLLEGDEFINWQDNAGFLWLEGPCAGKSVLSSAVIQHLFSENKKLFQARIMAPRPAVAFFYFDFRNPDRQSTEIALRRVVLQLSAQSPEKYETLNEEYELSEGQTLPNFEELLVILEKILRELGRTYIILDGLDECDDYEQVTELVSRLRDWTKPPLHLFIAAQPRSIFTEQFQGVKPLHFDAAQEDIQRFVTNELKNNYKLKIWRPHAARVIDQVTRKSKGMFRLAAMLLIELSKCKFVDKLDKTLKDLPDKLFAVYDRFFERIPKEDWVYVDVVLRWIMFSFQPLTLELLSDAIAFDFPAQQNTTPICPIDGRITVPRLLTGWKG